MALILMHGGTLAVSAMVPWGVPLAPRGSASVHLRSPTLVMQSFSDEDTASWDNFDDSSYADRGMSIVSEATLMDNEAILPDEVDSLLSAWQEEQAIKDDGLSELDEEDMMAQWRRMVEQKEQELKANRRAKQPASRHEISDMLPAHLTGWLVVGDDIETGGDAFALGDDDDDDDAAVADEVAVATEAQEENADEADAAFVAEWQLHAERERELASRAAATASPMQPAQLMTGGASSPLWAFNNKRQSEGGKPPIIEEESVGIDLGTTNCAVAAVVDGKPTIIASKDGARTFPSVVSFLSGPAKGTTAAALDGSSSALPPPLLDPNSTVARVAVGEAARRQAVTNPYSTYSSTKRLIGRTGETPP